MILIVSKINNLYYALLLNMKTCIGKCESSKSRSNPNYKIIEL